MKNLETKLQNELASEIVRAMENYSKYLTVKEVAKVESGVKTLESYRAKIEAKVNKGYAGKDITKLAAVSNEQRSIKSMTVTVSYTKSRTWGYCPLAELTVIYTNGNYDKFIGERAGGYGYDKESAATALVFNQCHALLKSLYEIKDSNIEQRNSECIGYGAGYGILPSFEGGVGFSCHRNIIEKLGFTYAHTANGKTFDVYSFTK